MKRIERVSAERLDKLRQQHELNYDNCSKCPFRNVPTTNNCVKCETFKELRKIGKWLLRDTANRSVPMKPNKAVKSEYGEVYLYIDATMSPEHYERLKGAEMTDKEIAARIEVSFTTFKNWKKSRGLTKQRGENKK